MCSSSSSSISSTKGKGGRCGTAASPSAGVSSATVEPSVDMHDAAVHVAAARGEEGDHLGDLLGRAHAAERHAGEGVGADGGGQLGGHRRVDEPGGDRVHQDVAAGELLGERLIERVETCITPLVRRLSHFY